MIHTRNVFFFFAFVLNKIEISNVWLEVKNSIFGSIHFIQIRFEIFLLLIFNLATSCTYTTYFDYLSPLVCLNLLPSYQSSLLNACPFPIIMNFVLFCDLFSLTISLYDYWIGTIHWSLWNHQWVHNWSQWFLLFLNLSAANNSSVSARTTYSLSSIHTCLLMDLLLCRSSVGICSCCDFVVAMTVCWQHSLFFKDEIHWNSRREPNCCIYNNWASFQKIPWSYHKKHIFHFLLKKSYF